MGIATSIDDNLEVESISVKLHRVRSPEQNIVIGVYYTYFNGDVRIIGNPHELIRNRDEVEFPFDSFTDRDVRDFLLEEAYEHDLHPDIIVDATSEVVTYKISVTEY